MNTKTNIAMTVADHLWGKKGRLSYLFIASAILLFTLLGARDLWTQEHRWADIVLGMFYRHDFLHPYLDDHGYYDKPLLSYWLIALFAELRGQLTTFVLRLPSALAGLLAVWSIYQLGSQLKDRSLGLLSGWMLLTTFYFVFWARTSSADMLNLAGSLFAVSWYFGKRHHTRWIDYAVFFLIVALTALCKGLVGVVVPGIAIAVEMILCRSFKQHLRLSLFTALLPALVVYMLPFIASSYWGHSTYHENGLYLVYRENILRYFHPFDHQGPIYTYFLYLPIYLLPWTLFFIPALFSVSMRFKSLPLYSKWIAWTVLVLFIFFTLSGSRRSYYILPIVPFAILFTADWLTEKINLLSGAKLFTIVICLWTTLWFALDILPAQYYAAQGVGQFASLLKQEASLVKPWREWHIVMLDAESKLNFYLALPPDVPHYPVYGETRELENEHSLIQAWPILVNKPRDTIFVTRKRYLPYIESYFKNYHRVAMPTTHAVFAKKDADQSVAFIPN